MSLLTKEEAASIEIPGPAWTVMCRINDENKALKDALGDALRRADKAELQAGVYKECHQLLVEKCHFDCPPVDW